MLSSRQLVPVAAAALLIASPLPGSGPPAATVIFVDACAAPGGDGTGWASSFRFLQDALAVASDPESGISEIRVAGGLYKPDRHTTFQLRSGLALRGGYAGFGAADPDERDPARYETILSGAFEDISDSDCCLSHTTPGCDCYGCEVPVCAALPSCCDIEWDDLCAALAAALCPHMCSGGSLPHNSRLVTTSGTDETAVLDGLTITGARNNVYNDNGSPTIIDCVITGAGHYQIYNINGSAPSVTGCTFCGDEGGRGIFNQDSTLDVIDCTFSNCRGAMVNINSSATVRGSSFLDNGSSQKGGAIHNESSNPEISDCLFVNNWGNPFGGSIYNLNSHPTVVDCTFTADFPNENWFNAVGGGGFYNDSSNPTLSGCVFDGLRAINRGGAIINVYGSSPTLTDCVFVNNTVSAGWGGTMYGGAVLNIEFSDPIFVRCTFMGNVAGVSEPQSHSEYGVGGAILNSRSEPTFVECSFIDNTASHYGGAMVGGEPSVIDCDFAGNSAIWGGGGGYYSGNGRYMLLNCSFRDNTARWAGAVADLADETSLIANCTFLGNSASGPGGGGLASRYGGSPVLSNCLFSGNTAKVDGGAIAVWAYSHATLSNCTIIANESGGLGGGIFVGAYPNGNELVSIATVSNCILWGNSDGRGTGESAQLHLSDGSSHFEAYVDYSCVQGLSGSLGGVGNIGDDPLFVDASGADGISGTADDNLRLLPGSPCIDAGNNWAVPQDTLDLDNDSNSRELVPFDLAGNPRFVHVPVSVHPGCGVPAVVDMGAYEFAEGNAVGIKLADIDGDGTVGMFDLVSLLMSWGPAGDGCQFADFDLDGIVAVPDLLTLLANWG